MFFENLNKVSADWSKFLVMGGVTIVRQDPAKGGVDDGIKGAGIQEPPTRPTIGRKLVFLLPKPVTPEHKRVAYVEQEDGKVINSSFIQTVRSSC